MDQAKKMAGQAAGNGDRGLDPAQRLDEPSMNTSEKSSMPWAAANSARLGSAGADADAKRSGSSRINRAVPGRCARRAAAANASRIQAIVRRTFRRSVRSPSRRSYRSQLARSSRPWASTRMKAKWPRCSLRGGGVFTWGTSARRQSAPARSSRTSTTGAPALARAATGAVGSRAAVAAARPPKHARCRRRRDRHSQLACAKSRPGARVPRRRSWRAAMA
jgi:hypothetical protein